MDLGILQAEIDLSPFPGPGQCARSAGCMRRQDYYISSKKSSDRGLMIDAYVRVCCIERVCVFVCMYGVSK